MRRNGKVKYLEIDKIIVEMKKEFLRVEGSREEDYKRINNEVE